MHNSRIKRLSLAVCFALLPLAANAAGLGKLTVISGLGEPLNAEVELSATSEELSSISAKIAPNSAYVDQGIERASALSGVRVELGKRPDGMPVLRLLSAQPINDPFLDMLIQVEWSAGRLLREYTALLDPPGYDSQAGVMSTPVSSAELPGSPSGMVTAPGPTRSKKAAPASDVAEAQAGDVIVKKGDTLRAIAAAHQIEGVSLEQMLVGLYRANKDAFAGNNMNRLKVGKIIQVPQQEELQSVTRQEAVQEIKVHTADWNTYRNKLAGMVAESAPAKEVPATQTAAGKITMPAEDRSTPPSSGPRDVVKLSKSETGDLKGRLTALQEEATAREKAVKESTERVASLEKQLQDMQKLLDIKSKSLADAQNAAKAPPPPPPAAAPKPVEPPKPAPVPPPPVVAPKPAEPPKVVEPPKPVPPPPPPAPAEVKKPAPEEVQPPVKKPKKVVRPVAPPPPPEPSLLDDLAGNLLPIGGGLLALVGGVWFYLRNKRRKGLDSFEKGILTTGGLKPNTVFGNTAGGTVDTGNTSFLTDFGQGATAGMIDTNDVDPIAEAEVYMAYGRDVQAEEILKDAITKEPKRYELHLKLLEILAGRKDNGAFETLAGEIYATLGASDPVWRKVTEMGRKLEPDNPLYDDTRSSVSPEPAVAEASAFDETMSQQAPAEAESAPSLDIGLGDTDTTLDFSLDVPESPEAVSEAGSESGGLDFEIGSLDLPVEESLATAAEVEPAEMEAPAELDMSLDLPEAAASDSIQLDVTEIGLEPEALSLDIEPGLAENDIGLTLDIPSADESVTAEPTTALDLSVQLDATETADTDAGVAEMTIEAETVPSGIALDLELPALEVAEPAQEEKVSAEPIALDIDFGVMDLPEEPILEVKPEVPTEIPAVQGEAEPAPADEAVAADAGNDLDFNFEVDLGEPVVIPADTATAASSSVPDLDLSGISLDIGGDTEEISLDTSNESPDVDTKLDLVTAYIDMGDKEGARELLQEVMQEGGKSQRAKAQQLLDSLG